MAKKQKQAAKPCADCIHESACRMWTDGRYISDVSASQCPNHETVKESSAYLCGVLDERKRRQTNADRIRSMSDEELVRMLTLGEGAFDCFKCRKVADGECDTNCPERCLDWLQRTAEEDDHAEDHD